MSDIISIYNPRIKFDDIVGNAFGAFVASLVSCCVIRIVRRIRWRLRE